MKEVYLTASIKEMLEKIREKHIDIVPIILEELDSVLLPYIENVIKNTYKHYNIGETK